MSRKVAVITGAAQGIGRKTAEVLAQYGYAIALNDLRSTRETSAAIGNLGGTSLEVLGDISKELEVQRIAAAVQSQFGRVDVLVNNAGVGLVRSVDDLTEADFDLTIAVNLKSVFLCTQAVLPGMRARKWGRIVNISSGAARGAGGVGPHYNASKAGMEGMTRGYAARLVKEGITVNAVAPSLIETDMVRSGLASAASRIPLGRFGTSEECAQVVMMLIGNAYMTGQTVALSGGMSFL